MISNIMNFIPFVIPILIIIVLSSRKVRSKLERVTFLRGFEIINDFELIQDWNANDFPVKTGRFWGSLLKSEVYVAIGKNNNKTYIVIKQVMTAPLSFNAQYMYLEESSIEKLKKMINKDNK